MIEVFLDKDSFNLNEVIIFLFINDHLNFLFHFIIVNLLG